MSDSARNILDSLKEQFALYKKQTTVLVSLTLVLTVVIYVRFVQDSPRSAGAAEIELPPAGSITIVHAPEAGDAGSRTAVPILAEWSNIHTTLERSDLFKGPWQIEQLQGAGENDADGDGVPDELDNCPQIANADQADRDRNSIGDVCDHGNTGAERKIDDIDLNLKGTTTPGLGRQASAYINRNYYRIGDTFRVDGLRIKLISVKGDSAVVQDEQGNTRVLMQHRD